MKNMVFKGAMLVSVLSFFLACNPKNDAPEATMVDTLQIKNEIQAKENLFAETYNAGEVKNIGYYADDAISFSQNRPAMVGKAAIIEYLITNKGFSNKTDKLSFTTKEVFISDQGNQVVEIGYYQVVDSTNTTINSGNYISLFVKKDGKYVCLRDMSTSDRPLE